jgi:hypothetical protein
MADKRHAFTPSDDDPKYCGHVTASSGRGFLGGSICGLPASNAGVHAPGCKPAEPERPHLSVVPDLDEPTVFLRGHAGDTEVQAAVAAKRVRGELRRKVLGTLYHPSHRVGGRIFDEIKADLRMPDKHSSITSAVRGLVLGGFVQALTDEDGITITRPSGSGVPSTAWTLTPAGLAACATDEQEASA